METGKFNNPYFDDIVGVTLRDPKEKDEIFRLVGENIEEAGSKVIEGFEIQKSPRDLEILNFVQDASSALMQRYGREKNIQIPMNRVHVLSDGGTEKFTKGRLRGGSHSSRLSSILIDRSPSDIQFCLIAFHEFLHSKSFKSLQITKPKVKEANPSLETYRSGFSVTSRDGKTVYFEDLEEAIIGLLTKEFFDTNLKTSGIFGDQMKEQGEANLPEIGRQKETQKLNSLIDELWDKNKGKFKSRDDIKNLFIDAQINGHLLQLGKLIESTLGKGSFREIANRK